MKLFTILLAMGVHFNLSAEDKYKNYSHLAQHEVENSDYKVEFQKRDSLFLILAIHGGRIEPTTSQITLAIAGPDLNYYLFEGLKTADNWALHISSAQFDEPRAVSLAAEATAGISIHGFKGDSKEIVCLGGLNTRLRDHIFRHLIETGLLQQDKVNPCDSYLATSKMNIVNRCRKAGVQVEISRSLRDRLRDDSMAMARFAGAIRRAIFEYSELL